MAGTDKLGAWDQHTHTTVYKTDNQQGPTVQHKGTLFNILQYPIEENNPQKNEYMYIYN